MSFLVFVHNKLPETIRKRVLDDKQSAFAAAADFRCRLVGIEEHRVLVAAIKEFLLQNAVRYVVAAVVVNSVLLVLEIRVNRVKRRNLKYKNGLYEPLIRNATDSANTPRICTTSAVKSKLSCTFAVIFA